MVQKKLLTKESVVMFQINVPNNSNNSNNIIENNPDDTKNYTNKHRVNNSAQMKYSYSRNKNENKNRVLDLKDN